MGCDECIAEYEEIKKSSRVNSARRAAYIERNQWMIDDSIFVVVHLLSKEKNSGTRLACEYAKKKVQSDIYIKIQVNSQYRISCILQASIHT